MSFTSILSSIGKGLGTVLPFLRIGSAVTAGTPAGGILETIFGVVAITEQLFTVLGKQNGTGPEKFAQALPYVTQIVMSKVVLGNKVTNQDLFNKGCQELLQGSVDIMNSIEAPATPAVPS